MEKFFSIAIDGPSGAGKSTLSRMVAGNFGFIYVDTGAIYRCVAVFMLRRNVDAGDEATIKELLPQVKVSMEYDEKGVQRMFLDGEDVSATIRLPEVSAYVSPLSAHKCVRAFLLEMQRDIARHNNIVMDGRDIGTVVLPNADMKIFLTASPEDRALRRYQELKTSGVDVTYEKVLGDLIIRDKNDSSRAECPLKAAEDAVIIDTTGNELEKSYGIIVNAVKERLKL